METPCRPNRIYIFIKDKAWHFNVKVKLHNNGCLIYIFTEEVLDGTPIFKLIISITVGLKN